jgi:hypothetical protein
MRLGIDLAAHRQLLLATASAVDPERDRRHAARSTRVSKKLDRGGRWTLVQLAAADSATWNESLDAARSGLLLEDDRLNLSYRGQQGHRAVQAWGVARRRSPTSTLRMKLFKENEALERVGTSPSWPRAATTAELWERAAALYEELIPLHQRTHRNRGIGRRHAQQLLHQASQTPAIASRRWDDAVDAASAAVVSWGRNQLESSRRPSASLTRRAPRAARTSTSSSIVRDAASRQETGEGAHRYCASCSARSIASRRMPAKAAAQLEIAVVLQQRRCRAPGDLLRPRL